MTLQEYDEIYAACMKFEEDAKALMNSYVGQATDSVIVANRLQTELTTLIKQSFLPFYEGHHLGILVNEAVDSNGTQIVVGATYKGKQIVTATPMSLGKSMILPLIGKYQEGNDND